ncbi:MAG TPA: hypothetical protein VGD67_27400, partial [Pseudonocardiaceae bacterium]
MIAGRPVPVAAAALPTESPWPVVVSAAGPVTVPLPMPPLTPSVLVERVTAALLARHPDWAEDLVRAAVRQAAGEWLGAGSASADLAVV